MIIFFDSSAMATWNFFTSRGCASSAGFSTLKTFSPEGSDRSIRGLFPPATLCPFLFGCLGCCCYSNPHLQRLLLNPSFAGRVFLKKLGHDWELRKVDEQLCSICQRLVATSSFTTPPSTPTSSSPAMSSTLPTSSLDPSKLCHLPGSTINCTPSIAIQVISNYQVSDTTHIQYGNVYDMLQTITRTVMQENRLHLTILKVFW